MTDPAFNFTGDGVPNAGVANNGIQAGTGQPPTTDEDSVTGSASVVNAPLSESPSCASDAQHLVAAKRLAIARAWESLQREYAERNEVLSLRRAATVLGVPLKTLWTIDKITKKHPGDYNALLPKFDKKGRKSKLDQLREVLGKDVIEDAVARVSGLKLDTESNTAAWRLFANSDACPEALAAVVLDPTKSSKHSLPPSFRRATRLTENLHNAHRGPRRLALKGMWTPRTIDILPGDIFSADDTTPIWAWWVPWEKSKEYPYGVKLMQGQFLPVIDVASQCCIAFVLIAREKSSYRAADIWGLFGHTFDTVGIPRLGWQLERGSWESNLIAGVEIEYQDGEATLTRRVGGLRQLPTTITDWHREKLGESAECFPRTLQTWTSYLPKSKSIEAWLNRSQTFEGTIYGCLGRDQMRKPFEKAKKQYEACRRGAADPQLHFLSQTEIMGKLRPMLDYLNSEPMEGEVFSGIPRRKFDQATQEHLLLSLPEDQRWMYRRDWKRVTITNGWARVRLTHDLSGDRYSLFYTHPRHFAELEGEDVVVYYDRERFEEPAQIIRARTGEHLCEAQYEERRGSFLEGDRSGHEIRSAWRHAVTSAYATIVAHAPSRQLPPEIAARRTAAAATVESHRTVSTVPAAQALATTSRRGFLPPPPTAEQAERTRVRLAESAEAARRLREIQLQPAD